MSIWVVWYLQDVNWVDNKICLLIWVFSVVILAFELLKSFSKEVMSTFWFEGWPILNPGRMTAQVPIYMKTKIQFLQGFPWNFWRENGCNSISFSLWWLGWTLLLIGLSLVQSFFYICSFSACTRNWPNSLLSIEVDYCLLH